MNLDGLNKKTLLRIWMDSSYYKGGWRWIFLKMDLNGVKETHLQIWMDSLDYKGLKMSFIEDGLKLNLNGLKKSHL